MSYLEVENLRVEFSDFLLDNINFRLERGKVLALLGPSGAGKSTIIQAIAGLVTLKTGRVVLNSRDITHLPIHKRRVGVVFQDFALFPHLNVYDNVAFGLRYLSMTRTEIRQEVMTLLELFGVENLASRDVFSLSGGERQRIALARTLAPKPEAILFDEPLSAIDEELRVRLREELSTIQKELRFTAIYVTHDREEAFLLGDLLGIVHKGSLHQLGSPREIYQRPKTKATASFLGIENSLKGKVVFGSSGNTFFETEEVLIPLDSGLKLQQNDRVDLLLKPENLSLGRAFKEGLYPVKIIESRNYGAKNEMIFNFAGKRFKAINLSSECPDSHSDTLYLKINSSELLVYKENELVS